GEITSPRRRPRETAAGSAEEARQLHAGSDAEPYEDVPQVVVDGAVAEEEPRRDLPVGGALGGQAGDLALLRGELLGALVRRCRGGLPRRAQFGARVLGPVLRFVVLEDLQGVAQVLAGHARLAPASQPMPVQQLRPRHLERRVAALVQPQRLAE